MGSEDGVETEDEVEAECTVIIAAASTATAPIMDARI
jgi:hypothetical protein